MSQGSGMGEVYGTAPIDVPKTESVTAVAEEFRRAHAGDPLLSVRDLRLQFGGVKAVDGTSFDAYAGEIISVIGPNGAGKTSAFNCITGFYRPTSGTITFDGVDIMRKQPSTITRLGLSRTFQNVRMFRDMSVIDNVKTAMHARIRQNVFQTMLHTIGYKKIEAQALEDARGWLDFVGYSLDDDLLASQLPYGEQRRVEIARALATQPKLLLLDEPAAGLNHNEKQELIALIRKIRDLGVGIVLIEHDMGLVMEISERVIVLNFGREIADGLPEDVKSDPRVIEAYLGVEDPEDEVAEEVAVEELASPERPRTLRDRIEEEDIAEEGSAEEERS